MVPISYKVIKPFDMLRVTKFNKFRVT